MTGLCHEASEQITVAATWYRQHREECPRPIVPHLRQTFGLSALEACEAIAEANRRQGGAHARTS
ncbi:hypothetical protein GGE12_005055 [Rhizobium mongolense]|uniref:Uncharacterized protein n=1 Tax=Rhizobium mongolense TaxID=57676 RepID=A0A7W6WG93_9HYPH|nr:hypothetical protein [Rhizobium mongolense]